MDMWVGIDLGKLVDPTALSIMARSIAVDPVSGLPQRSSRGDALYGWKVTKLKRYHLGTPYTAMVDDVVRLVQRLELQPAPRLVIDGSGVGVAVVDMFRSALSGHPDIEAHAISITSGHAVSLVGRHTWNVAKIEVVGAMREVLEARRLKVARMPNGQHIEFADILKRELMDFRVKITTAANETFAAQQEAHDDLVLSVALPVWLGSQRCMQMRTQPRADDVSDFRRPREIRALDAEQAATRAGRGTALKRERENVNLRNERNRDRQRRLDREIEQNVWSDYLWDCGHGHKPPWLMYFVVKTDDPELLETKLCTRAARTCIEIWPANRSIDGVDSLWSASGSPKSPSMPSSESRGSVRSWRVSTPWTRPRTPSGA